MTQTITENDLVRFIYRETNEEETKMITQALWDNPALRLEYGDLMLTMQSLDGAMLRPSSKVKEEVLNYSKSLDLPPMLQ